MECNRCHRETGLGDAPRDKHCVHCHAEITAGTFPADARLLRTWKPHVEQLRFTPSLGGVGTTIRPDWVRGYLLSPRDLRPSLHPTMPRLDLDDHDAASIAAYLASNAAAPPAQERAAPRGDLDRGRRLFTDKGCSTCHAFTGARTPAPAPVEPADGAGRVLAPDLAFARDRVIPERVAAWIVDPKRMRPDAAMPAQALSPAEAADLTAFILHAPLDPSPPPASLVRLPVLDRAVGYEEVAERVLHKICWHCHSQPDYARGDGGPGNTGGFGFAPRRLDLASYESIAAGYVDARGERRSLFSPTASGDPVLLAVLLARQHEERGRAREVRGMPLGLPPMSPEDVQLVETWIAQGHPR
jgi:mono/diheme cytochrome c family protein